MECGCQDDYCDFDNGPECYRQIWRKARKDHKCCECYRDIKKGEKYQYISGIWDGRPSSFKTCKQCATIRDEYFCGCSNLTELKWEVAEVLGVEL